MQDLKRDFFSSEDIKNNIKTNLVLLRKENNLSKRDVANALNMNENTYRIWEDPKKSCPKPYDIYKIAQIYGVSVDFILTNHEAFNNKVASEKSGYNGLDKNIYLVELDDYEKLLVLNVRTLTKEQQNQLNTYIHDLLSE